MAIEMWQILESEVMRAKYSQKERESMDTSDFGDPENLAFPIKTAEDVIHAAERLHNAGGNQEEIKRRIIAIAKRKGFPLPQTWQEGDKGKKEEERAVETELETQRLAQVAEQEGVTASDRVGMYLPITRAVAAENGDWVIEGQATSEAVDSYETIFDFDSSKKAFERWRGNIREQHDPKKAVGRAIHWEPDNTNRRIILRSLISKGAADTWQKIQDGVLTGYSIALKPGFKTKWVTRGNKQILCYHDFDLGETSVVDAPGSPSCDIGIVRADGFVTDVVDLSEEPQPAPAAPTIAQNVSTPTEPVERAGARLSQDTINAVHEARDHAMNTARKLVATCGCPDCAKIASALDPDNDGDVDIPGSSADTDHDAEQLAERVLAYVEQHLAERTQPALQRFQALAGRFAAINDQTIDFSPLTASIAALDTKIERLGQTSNLDEVRASLEAVKGQVERIAAQPAAGGPVLNAADKRLATQTPQRQALTPEEERARLLAELSRNGVLETNHQQVAAASLMLRPFGGG